jgi:hypothetical protein
MAVFSVIYSNWLGYYRNVDRENLSNKDSSIEKRIFFEKLFTSNKKIGQVFGKRKSLIGGLKTGFWGGGFDGIYRSATAPPITDRLQKYPFFL